MAVTWKKLAFDADLTTHTGDTTTAHGAVSAATASKIVVRDASARAAFAAPAAAGDALIKGTALTITEMAALTTGKIWQGVANRPSEVDIPAPGIWTLLETLSPAAVASISSGALTAYDMFMVIFRLQVSEATSIVMRLNSEGGTNYAYRRVTGITWSTTTGASSMYLIRYASSTDRGVGVIYLPGTLGAVSVPVSLNLGTTSMSDLVSTHGYYNAAANITSFTFLVAAGTITGKIKIYGMNF